MISETLSKVLYPNDEPEIGKRLRLAQQYFFVSCSLQDMLRLLDMKGETIERLPDLFAVQLNDTHPSIAVAELMRLLVDERMLPWEQAWDITRRTLAYTNHTLLPEALETWGLPLFQDLLPRPLEIIYEINRRFLEEVRERYPGDDARVARLSLIDETGEQTRAYGESGDRRQSCRQRRGGAALRAPETNRAARLRRALAGALLQRHQRRHAAPLRGAQQPGSYAAVERRRWAKAGSPTCRDSRPWKRAPATRHFRNSGVGSNDITKRCSPGASASAPAWWSIPATLFDIQVKRIHEYKRQHLNVLHIITLYQRLRDNPQLAIAPRCFIFGGKAAPGYHMAKLIIRLINGVAEVVNNDPAVRGRLKVVFFPDFNVTHAHEIYPAADLSEQISTAGKEASGTGNMKFMLNGALTIGTLDGANVEIREEVGAENFFLFGLTAQEVAARKAGGYRPRDYYERDAELRAALDLIASGAFRPWRSECVSAAAGSSARSRRVSSAGGLSRVCGRAVRGRRSIPRPRTLGTYVDSQRGTRRQVLVGPGDPGIQRAHLESKAGADPNFGRRVKVTLRLPASVARLVHSLRQACGAVCEKG